MGSGLVEDWERYDLLIVIPGSDWLTHRPRRLPRAIKKGVRAWVRTQSLKRWPNASYTAIGTWPLAASPSTGSSTSMVHNPMPGATSSRRRPTTAPTSLTTDDTALRGEAARCTTGRRDDERCNLASRMARWPPP